MFRGSVIDSEYKGTSTIGNHEADYGLAHLLFLEKCVDFPIINANFHIKSNGKQMFQPFWIAHIDGMKVLFIGIITEDVLAATKSEDLIGFFVDIGEAAKEIGNICNAYNAIDTFTWQLVPINDKHCPRDEELEKFILRYKDATSEKYDRIITRFSCKLGRPRRNEETPLSNLITDILRDEAFQGEHTEFYQFSHGLRMAWSRIEEQFRELTLDGEPLHDDRLYSVAVQKYHHNNLKDFLNISLEEVEQNGKVRVLSTSARDVIEEYLTVNQHLSRTVEGRLVMEP